MRASFYPLLALCLPVLIPPAFTPAFAQDTGDDSSKDIVVTAQRLRGAVETDVPPVQVLNADDINAYGASSITDLLSALSPQTGSGRGRGGGQNNGMPIILLNGQRISGFRELRNIPSEAIRQVQVFPEEVALQYGFRPDQRVVNFILRDNFASFTAELEGGAPESGGYSDQEVEATFTTIGASTRINLNANYQHSDNLSQADRNIVSDTDDDRFEFDGNINDFRSLRPKRDQFDVGGSISKILGKQTNLSASANYQLQDSFSLLGLPSATLLLPGSSPFSPSGTDIEISRNFLSPGPLLRNSVAHSASFGSAFNTLLAGWRWSATADYNRTENSTRTNRNADFTALRRGLIAGTENPFASGFGSRLSFIAPDTADSNSQNLSILNIFSGALFRLPAGPVLTTITGRFNRQTLESRSQISGQIASARLARSDRSAAVNIDIPLTERGVGAFGFVGDVAINGNYGVSDLSDFGGLTEYTAGIRWSPVKALTLQASLIGDESPPTIALLGNPSATTPNVSFFDFGRGETALIDVISGGNPELLAEKRRDWKVAANWQPETIFGIKTDGINIGAEYFRNKGENISSAFPLLTPEIEAAFLGRVTRDAAGRLLRVDQRPVNFAEEKTQRIRWGFNFSGGIGPQQRAGFGGGGPSRRADTKTPETQQSPATTPVQPPRTNGPGRSGLGGGGVGRASAGGFGGGPPSRWQISAYHTYQIQDELLIAPGVPLLDRLGGSATSALGGTPRHRIELSGGVFYKGLGTRIEGNHQSATIVTGGSDLRFGSLTTLNLRLFVNLNDRGNLTQKVKFLKGSRIAIGVDNVFDDIIDVRDENGSVPLSLQPGFIDPIGRYFEVSFRKQF
ncbi:MAG: TonB-dependent receptor plug domain-containing protein [Sphingorhabdus sp.]|nr:TonB-dependent receptor plug domain-containing protein [Sphingorhabdus sp.]